jgi:hypothetical protein
LRYNGTLNWGKWLLHKNAKRKEKIELSKEWNKEKITKEIMKGI